MTNMNTPVKLAEWVNENRKQFKQPVGNKEIWHDESSQFIFMISHGPNSRNDFHINDSDEIFHQMKGPVCIDWIDDNDEVMRTDVKEGDVFTMPALVPHSPNRPADSWGIVVQKRRQTGEADGIRWYCQNCREVVHEDWFALTDIGSQVKNAIDAFNSSEERRTCKNCGEVHPVADEFKEYPR